MSEILALLPDELKFEVLSFFSGYKVDTDIAGSNISADIDEEFYTISNIAKQVVCCGLNEDGPIYGEIDDYELHTLDDYEFNTKVKDDPDNKNGFCIVITTFNIMESYRIDTSYLFSVKYLKNTYYHSNMWLIKGDGDDVLGGTIFVSDDDLTDIMKQLDIDNNIISETLEKYKEKAK